MEEELQANQDDDHHNLPPKPIKDHHSNVDTSRAFSSVREAVAIFGQRILLPSPGDLHNINNTKPNKSPPVVLRPKNVNQVGSSSSSLPKPPSPTSSPHQNTREDNFLEALKTLEAELKETRTELRLLKERESETEVALASLNAELHKNMSKMAKAEADAAGKRATVAATAKTVSFETNERENTGVVSKGEEMRKDLMKRMESEYPTLAQILDGNSGDFEGYFGRKEKKKTTTRSTKKKPIVPLVGDFFFFKKKDFSGEISGPFFTRSTGMRL